MEPSVKQSTATLQLRRRLNVVHPLIVYVVEIDGQVAAELTIGKRDSVAVVPGRHRLQVKALFWSSRELEVEVEAGQTSTIEIAPDVRHLWRMVVKPGTFLHMERAA